MRLLRNFGIFVGHLITVSIGVTLVTEELVVITRRHTWQRTFLAEDLLNSIVAFVFGCVVYYKVKSTLAQWTWAVGVFWFGLRALHIVHGYGGTLLYEMSLRVGAVNTLQQDFSDWVNYTLPLIRTVFYSVGALYCSHLVNRGKLVNEPSLEDQPAPPPERIIDWIIGWALALCGTAFILMSVAFPEIGVVKGNPFVAAVLGAAGVGCCYVGFRFLRGPKSSERPPEASNSGNETATDSDGGA